MRVRLYPDGTKPLVDVENELMGVEWCAALYESYAADHEVIGSTAGRRSRAGYAAAAEGVAVGIEYAWYEAVRCSADPGGR